MGLIQKTIPGFWNGISQQSPTVRKSNQAELQENALGSLVDGLIKRPNTEHLAVLTSNAESGCFIHGINRDTDDQYIVVITGDTTEPIEVFKMDGTKCTVRYGTIDADGTYTQDNTKKAYVTSSNPAKEFKAITVADYTFIVNLTVTCVMKTDTTSGTLTGSVQSFPDLPGSPSTGDIYEVAGDDTNNFDNYYMVYGSDSVWRETVKPGVEYAFDEDTMPHRLVITDTDEFTFAPIIWGDRVIGDENSAPEPTFIGHKMNNVFFYKNRLGFLSRDNVILSQAGAYFNFWPQTCLDILDDDPIDTSASAKEIETLRSTAVFDKSLILLADQQQFDFGSGDSALTPRTVAITPTTRFGIRKDCEPVTAGANVYFVSPKTNYVSIREYFIQPDSLTADAADVTAHVPKYIPNDYIRMAATNTMDMLFVHSEAEPNALYNYKYFWVGQEKPQSSWSKWTFDSDIIGVTIINSVMYLVTTRTDSTAEVTLEKVELENNHTGDLDFRVHLDRMKLLTGVYAAGVTTWSLPYHTTDTNIMLINSSTGQALTGAELDTQNDELTIDGDYSAADYYVGVPYTMRYRLSEWFLHDENKVAITSGRLQTRRLILSFKDTGYFKVEVTPASRNTLTHEFTGVVLGVAEIGTVGLYSDEASFLVMTNARGVQIDIVNDSYLPSAFQTGMLEGWFHTRGKVIK